MRETVSEDDLNEWKVVATSARWTARVLSQIGDPQPDSGLFEVDALYPEKASDWCRGYLDAASEHMVHWADFAAPIRWHPDHVVTHTFRPVQTLARAAMEAAAQAVWILSSPSNDEANRRHLCLIRWDYEEHRKSLPLERKHVPREMDQRLLEAVSDRFSPDQLRPPSYLSVLRETAVTLGREPDEIEAVWRAASGSAHGKRWPAHALQQVTPGDEYEPGQFRATVLPDAAAMTRVLKVADAFLARGIQRFVQLSGADFQALHADAMQWLLANLPRREDPTD